MAVAASIVKTTDGTFIPATAFDADVLGRLKIGQPYKVEVKTMNRRSYQHHKLFFGGLLPLAYEYWKPTGGMMRKSEQEAVHWVIREICRKSGADRTLMTDFADQALRELAGLRGERFGAAVLSMEAFRKWLTVEAGYFDIVETPEGARKEAKSISFASMEQEEFNRFYQACFQVAWNMMLAAVFDSEEAAQEAAVQKMLEMG